MTSLAKQLRRLAIPGQPTLKDASSKKRPSLLFEPEKASDISIDTIYSLGLNGLAELINIDHSFAEFEATLFQESGKEFERSVQTKEELERVAGQVDLFLRRLSPYFLQRAAQKCLEWLIRVFQVHSYHVDALMECVLPYYQTNLFARVVQLLPLKDHTSKWHWLLPVKKTGSPLSKVTFVQHCLSDLAFLHFVCESVPLSLKAHRDSAVKGFRKVISLYTSTVMGVLERSNPVGEEVVLRLVPYLEKGLKSKHLDYRACTYMILSQLAVLVKMEESLLKALVNGVSKSLCDPLLKDGLCCLAVLCDKQKLSKFSNKALQCLVKADSLVPTLCSLASDHTLTPLLSTLLTSLLDYHLTQRKGDEEELGGCGASLTLLLELLDEVHLEQEAVYLLTRLLLDTVVSQTDHCNADSLVLSLESKFPAVMDKAVEDCIASIHSAEAGDPSVEVKVKLLHDFVATSLPKSRHQVLMDASSTLVLSVHHHNPTMRRAAVNQLGKRLGAKGKETDISEADCSFISSSLSNRLSDEDPSVVQAVLELGPKVLCKWLSLSELLPPLSALLSKKKLYRASEEWQDCALKTLSTLTSKSLLDVAPELGVIDDIIIKGIPLLFLMRNGNAFGGRVADVLGGSALSKRHPVLKGLDKVSQENVWRTGCKAESYRDENALASANAALFAHLGERIGQLGSGKLGDLLHKLVGVVCSTPIDRHEYFALIAVALCALKATPPSDAGVQHREAMRLLSHFRENLEALSQGIKKSQVPLYHKLSGVLLPLLEKHADKALSMRLLQLWALEGISETLLVPQGLSSSMWLNMAHSSTSEQLYYNALLTLFSLLTEVMDLQLEGKGQGIAAPCKILIQDFLKHHFVKRGSLLRFLAMIWTTPLGAELGPLPVVELSPVLQARSLSIACAYLRSLDVQAALALTGNQCPVVPSLLIPLSSPHRLLRENSIDCLLALQDICASVHPIPDGQATPPRNCPPALHLVHALTKSSQEILSDHTQIGDILGKLRVDTPSLPPPPPTPTRRSKRLEAALSDTLLPGVGGGVGVEEGWLGCVLVHVVSLGMPVFIQQQFLTVLRATDHIMKPVCLAPLISVLMEEIGRKCSAMETDSATEGKHDLLEYEAATLQLAMESFTPLVAQSLSLHPQLFQLLLSLMGVDTPCSRLVESPLLLVLHQISPAFFGGLPDVSLQQTMLGALVDTLMTTRLSEVTAQVRDCLAKLPLSAVLVAGELTRDAVKLEKDLPCPTPSKKRRVRAATPPVPMDTDGSADISTPWKRVTVVLELFEHGCHLVSGSHTLVPVLFGLLSRSLELDEQERFGLEYCQQLILSCLLNIVTHLSSTQSANINDLIPETQFNVELIVQCIRLSSTPQTHHHAYLLLSTAATIFPELVLHNIMPIFTFMGASILRQDSLYSFQIITKTIDTIIPPLIQSTAIQPTTVKKGGVARSKTTPTTVDGVVSEILRTFVDAVPHIPDHRRLMLFSHLIETVGPSDYLHVGLGLLVEKQVLQATGDKAAEAKVNIDFCVSVAQKFPPAVQVLAAYKLIHHLVQLPEEKPTSAFKLRQLPPSLRALFNVPAHTDKQLRQFKSLSLSTMIALLVHKDFVGKITAVNVTSDVEENIIKLLQCALGYISHLNKSLDSMAGAAAAATKVDGGKHYKIFLKKCYLVVDKVTSLLSSDAFLEVISQLVGVANKDEGATGHEDVQEKALGMLYSKLDNPKTRFKRTHDPYMLSLLDVLMGVACEAPTPVASRQMSLNCVRLLVRRLTGSYNKKISEVLRKQMEMLNQPDLLTSLRSSCFQCVEDVSLSLGPHLIPHLPFLLSLVLSQLGKKPMQKSQQVQLLLSATSALGAIVRTLPNFLSSSASDIILKVCYPGMVGGGEDLTKLENCSAEVRGEMSKLVPVRNLLPAYLQCYPGLVPLGKDSVLAVLGMLSVTVSRLSREEGKVHCDLLLEIFLTCLDYRAQQTEDVASLGVVGAVEGVCLDAFAALVVKLSEVQFRPVLLKLLDWACSSKASRARLITFYHLADRVAEKLKGLFLLFAGHVISNIVMCLELVHSQKQGTDFFSNVVLRAPRGEEEEEMDGEEDGMEKEGEEEGEDEDEESEEEEEEDDEDEESEKMRDSKEEEEEEEEEDDCEKELLKKERVEEEEEEEEEGEEEESEMEEGDGDEAKDAELVAIEQSCLIVQYILQCLTKCFLYDKTGFLSKERFDSLLQPLVGQVTNIIGGVQEYRIRVKTQLTSCVAYFGVAAGKESLWKPLNRQLLLHTKHKNSQVRCGALEVMHELYTKLGEEMVVLLPETTPYLYELMEDDCEEVEQLTKEVIKTIEKICGETLQF